MPTFNLSSSIAGVGLALVVLLAGCAARAPRILEVSHAIRDRTIMPADEGFFVRDYASSIWFPSKPLPAEDQRQEFYVRWASGPASIELVKLEYRLMNRPAEIFEQTVHAEDRSWARFEVRGKDFVEGGHVSAWRVTLWDADRLLAEKRSALW